MDKEIIINVAPHEKRIAVLEDKKLAGIVVERPEHERIVGNIYKGRVVNVLPGLQSAFLDIGLEKAAFLNISDVKEHFFQSLEDYEEADGDVYKLKGRRNKPSKIEEIFKSGQEVVVQVLKEPLSTKGAKITNSISIAGRFLVLIPDTDFIGVSKKTRDRRERKRVKDLINRLKPDNIGFIIRTIGKKRSDREFEFEIKDLVNKWNQIKKQIDRKKPPHLLFQEDNQTSVTIRDIFSKDFKRLVVDSKGEYNQIIKYLKKRSPELLDRIFYYSEKPPIFEVFGIEDDMEKSLRRKVWTKGGGYVIFDYTEAMVVIDVNSGRNIGKRNVEETILKTNLEAAKEIARQIRLRDLGGLIVIDFIDMRIPGNRRKLLSEFYNLLRTDRAPFNLGKISEFGIVEMTRKRVRENLITSFSEICEGCGGTGHIFSKTTVVAKIDRCMDKIKNILRVNKVILSVNPAFGQYLEENGKKILKEIQKAARISIVLEADRHLPMDAFQVFDMERNVEYTKMIFK